MLELFERLQADNFIFRLASLLNVPLEISILSQIYKPTSSPKALLIQRLNNCGLGPGGKHELSERPRLPSFSSLPVEIRLMV